MVDQATGFIRTVPGAFQGPSGGTNLNLDLTGGAVPPVSRTTWKFNLLHATRINFNRVTTLTGCPADGKR